MKRPKSMLRGCGSKAAKSSSHRHTHGGCRLCMCPEPVRTETCKAEKAQSKRPVVLCTSGPFLFVSKRSGANCDRRDIGGSREPIALAMRPANPGPVFPAVEHLSEIAMRLFLGSLVGIGGPRPFRFQVILPYASVLTPMSRNTVTRIVAGGVAHPKQCQNNQDALQFRYSTRWQNPRDEPSKREDEKLQPSRSRNSCDVWQKFGRVVPE